MIRILTTNGPSAVTFTIDGQLVGDYVDAVEASVDQAIREGRAVHLFLRDVSHIDEGGRKLLSRLAAKGVELSASGVYSSYIVAEVSNKRAGRPATIPMNGTRGRPGAQRRPVADTKPDSCDSRGAATEFRKDNR
jgi:hypothetical protein